MIHIINNLISVLIKSSRTTYTTLTYLASEIKKNVIVFGIASAKRSKMTFIHFIAKSQKRTTTTRPDLKFIVVEQYH
jgi:hypothetical protein